MPYIARIFARKPQTKRFVVFGILFVLTLSSIGGGVVFSAAEDHSPDDRALAWNAVKGLTQCYINPGEGKNFYTLPYNEKVEKSSAPFGAVTELTIDDANNGKLFGHLSDGGYKNVGYMIEPKDGRIACYKQDELLLLFKALGMSEPYKELLGPGEGKLGLYATIDNTQKIAPTKTNEEMADAIIRWAEKKYGFDLNGSMPDGLQYPVLYAAYKNRCYGSITTKDGGGVEVKRIGEDPTKPITTQYILWKESASTPAYVGYGLDGDGGNNQTMQCKTIIEQMNSHIDAYQKALLQAKESKVENKVNLVVDDASTNEPEDSCESNGGPLSWVLCPAVTMVDNTLEQIDSYVQELLTVNFLGDKNTDDSRTSLNEAKVNTQNSLKQSWVNIRNLAYIILVPIVLVMVIGTAVGSQYVDAYTVKKAFPRMVIAAIFIALSWYLCVFLINFVDVLGSGIRGIILSPFYKDAGGVPGTVTLASLMTDAGILSVGDGGSNAVQAGGGLLIVGGAMLTGVASIGIILSTILSVAIILGIAFILLVARQIIIMALLLISPLAILSWIFPGNDKLWKFWWGAFSKLLFLFPVIMAMIAMGTAFAKIVVGL